MMSGEVGDNGYRLLYVGTLLLTKIGSCNICDYTNTDCMYCNVHNSYRIYIVVQKVIHVSSEVISECVPTAYFFYTLTLV